MALTPFRSQLIADVGISMGDEGKGRLVKETIDDLRRQTGQEAPMGIVLKVNGGANSGHTAGGLKLNLVPSGVIDPTVHTLTIGSGVVADPRKFLWEIATVEASGHNAMGRLLIDERTMVSDVAHRLLDLAWEHYRVHVLGEEARGSTGRGISPAYVDEVAHFQIFYGDFRGPRETYAAKLRGRLDRAAATIQHVCQLPPAEWTALFARLTEAEQRAHREWIEQRLFKAEDFDFNRFCGAEPFTFDQEAVERAYWDAGVTLAPRVGDVREAHLKALAAGESILGEFGQSYWLDKRIGFSPNLTASHTYVPELFQSAGLPAQPVHTIGVCKAYDTKVGTHTFHSQIPDGHPLGERLKRIEFGTSTGRQRMVGWFDAVEKGDALRYGGFDDLMLNKLDALSYGPDWQRGELLICHGYLDPDGQLRRHVPRDPSLHKQLTPAYLTLPGWEEDIRLVRSFAHLPRTAQRYVATCVKCMLEVANPDNPPPLNVRYIGVGPDPSQIISDVPEVGELLAGV